MLDPSSIVGAIGSNDHRFPAPVLDFEGRVLPALDRPYEQVLLSSWSVACSIIRCLGETAGAVMAAQESVGLLVTCVKFQIQGSAEAVRRMLPLVFHREQGAQLQLPARCKGASRLC